MVIKAKPIEFKKASEVTVDMTSSKTFVLGDY